MGVVKYFRDYGIVGALLHSYMAWHLTATVLPYNNLEYLSIGGPLKVAYDAAEITTPKILEPSRTRFGPWIIAPNPLRKEERNLIDRIMDNKKDDNIATIWAESDKGKSYLQSLNAIPEPLRTRGDPYNLIYALGAGYAAQQWRNRRCLKRVAPNKKKR